MDHSYLSSFKPILIWLAKMAGKPQAFIISVIVLIIWTIIGLIWGFTTHWILFINTLGTINASLMVFVIQNTQCRENKALHLKIDELLRVNHDTERELIAIEQKEDLEIELIKMKIEKKQ